MQIEALVRIVVHRASDNGWLSSPVILHGSVRTRDPHHMHTLMHSILTDGLKARVYAYPLEQAHAPARIRDTFSMQQNLEKPCALRICW